MSQGQWFVKSGGQKKQVPTVGLKISIPKFDNSNLITGYSRTLIGRCMNPFKQEMKQLLYHLPRIWNVEEKVVGADLGLGRFQFDFQEEDDIVEVLKREPFHFDGWMLSIVRWEPVVEDNYPSKIIFWVRVIGVPLHFWAEPTFKSIGGALGQVRGDDDIDVNEGKVRVVVDAFKPLIFSMTVEFHSGEESVIALRYERLHGFCRTCSSLRHDQTKCPTTKGATGEDGAGPSDKPDHDDKALSYKGAVELQPKENHPEGEARRQYHQTTGKHDYKGEGVASERERNASLARGGPGRRSREQERAVPKYVRQAGYLPPKELQDSYLMATDGINGLRNQDVGNHLDDNQKLMLDAFKSGGTKEMSGSKTRKALQFEEEPSVEMNQEDEGKTQVEAKGCGGSMEISVETVENTSDEVQGLKNTVETSDLNVSLESQVPKPSEEKLEIHEVELGSGVEGGSLEMVAGLGNEDGNLEYVMSEEGEEEDQEEFSLEDTNTDDTEMVMADARVLEKGPQTDVVGELTEEKGRQKKKSGKLQAAATGGNAKKRTVQCFASPRKKVMAKHFSKVGEKGPAPKKALAKTKPDQV
ncbi:unnamed protein product [Brassica rapa subsp. trilocularis]